jgi:hypothetical protein
MDDVLPGLFLFLPDLVLDPEDIEEWSVLLAPVSICFLCLFLELFIVD